MNRLISFCRLFGVFLLLSNAFCAAQSPQKASEVKLDRSDAKMLSGHHSAILSLAVSPDGQTIATGSVDRNVVLWNAAIGREKNRLQTVGAAITAMAFNADGSQIATGGKNRDIVLWNAADGRELTRFPGHKGSINSLALHPEGQILAFGLDNGQAGIWNIAEVKPIHPLNVHVKAIGTIVFSPKDNRVALASEDKTISIWNAETGKQLFVLEGHRSGVDTVAFDPDGKRLASGSADRTIIVWNSRTGKEMLRLEGHGDAVCFVAFASDGRTIYSASKDGTFIQWDATTGRMLVRCKLDIPVFRAAISSDGTRIVAAANDSKALTFRTESMQFIEPAGLATEEKGPFARLPKQRPLLRLAPSLTANDKKTESESGTKDVLATPRSPKGNVVAFHPNGPFAASAGSDSTGLVWDIEKEKPVYTFSYTSSFTCIDFSPIGNVFAVGAVDGSVLLFESQTGKQSAKLRGHTSKINHLVFSKNGKRLISASADRSLVLWNVETGRAVGSLLGHEGSVTGVAITPDMSTAVSVSEDKTIRLWNAASLKNEIMDDPTPKEERSPYVSLALSPSGKWLAVGKNDKTITVWNLDERKPITTLTGLTEPATCLAVTPSETFLASGGNDGQAIFWNTKNWRPVLAFPQISQAVEEKLDSEAQNRTSGKKWSSGALRQIRYEPVRAIAFSKDGSDMLTSGGSETLLWEVGNINIPKAIPPSPSDKSSASVAKDLISPLPLGKEIRRFETFSSRLLAVALNRDASKLAVSEESKRFLLLDAETGREILRLTARTPYETLGFLTDGRTILAGGEDGHFFSLNFVTKKDNFVRKVHTDRINCLDCTPGGTRAVTGGGDRVAVVWDLRKGEHLGRLTGHRSSINGVAVNRDGSRVVTVSDDRTAVLWDARSFKAVETLPEFQQRVLATTFSPDGKRFAVSTGGGEIILYLTANGKEVRRFQGNRQPVTCLEFAQDGVFLLAGSEQGNVVLWNAETGIPLSRCLAKFQPLVDAVFAPDAKTILVADPKGVSFWEMVAEQAGKPKEP